jgi:hypothetical protein
MEAKPIRIFISYCHENEIWFKEYQDEIKKDGKNPRNLLGFWRRSLAGKNVEFWYDRIEGRGIKGGDDWKEKTFYEVDHCDIVILFITQDFIASSFIQNEELPRILQRRRR